MSWSRPRKGIDWDAQPLGQMSDKALAARLGCSAQNVAAARKTRGIVTFCVHLTLPRDLSVTLREAADVLGMDVQELVVDHLRDAFGGGQ